MKTILQTLLWWQCVFSWVARWQYWYWHDSNYSLSNSLDVPRKSKKSIRIFRFLKLISTYPFCWQDKFFYKCDLHEQWTYPFTCHSAEEIRSFQLPVEENETACNITYTQTVSVAGTEETMIYLHLFPTNISIFHRLPYMLRQIIDVITSPLGHAQTRNTRV
jgi:hypothetical protein